LLRGVSVGVDFRCRGMRARVTINEAPLSNALSFGNVDGGLRMGFYLSHTLSTPPRGDGEATRCCPEHFVQIVTEAMLQGSR
jgi:hypothetical protein